MKELTVKEYKKIRAKLIEETKWRIEGIRQNIKAFELDGYFCSKCRKRTHIRIIKRDICMDCYIREITKGSCSKCRKPIIKENPTDKCLNRNRCRTTNIDVETIVSQEQTQDQA